MGKRAWSYAGVLRDAGLSCFEYVEQLTLLLFLKMADQLTEPPWKDPHSACYRALRVWSGTRAAPQRKHRDARWFEPHPR